MKIIGIGTDMVNIERIDHALKRHGMRFAKRILHPVEWQQYQCRTDLVNFLAKRFAVKEATSKALGVGIGASMALQDAWVDYSPQGQPRLHITGKALYTAKTLGVSEMYVSIADEREFALAFVILAG